MILLTLEQIHKTATPCPHCGCDDPKKRDGSRRVIQEKKIFFDLACNHCKSIYRGNFEFNCFGFLSKLEYTDLIVCDDDITADEWRDLVWSTIDIPRKRFLEVNHYCEDNLEIEYSSRVQSVSDCLSDLSKDEKKEFLNLLETLGEDDECTQMI